MILPLTLWTRISWRVMVMVSGLSSSLRLKVSVTLEPGSPRIFFTLSSRFMPLIGVPSMRVIRSPALMPALNAGVSSIGETTLM